MVFYLAHIEQRLGQVLHGSERIYCGTGGLARSKGFLPCTPHFKIRRAFQSNIPLNSPASVDKQDTSSKRKDRSDWRPMTIKERAYVFPGGAMRLIQELVLYKNIHDASRTSLNAWTLNHPFRKSPGNKAYHIYDGELRPGRIPRRQHEQQRRAIVDVTAVAPILILWLIPVFGYVPMFLAVAAPRQILSRQFHNEFEIYHYARLEYEQRKIEFAGLMDLFWNAASVDRHARGLRISSKGKDTAGPVVDALPLYPIFSGSVKGIHQDPQLRANIFPSVSSAPPQYLVKLALAVGVNQHLPGWLSPAVTKWSPQMWLRYRVRRIALFVAEDDELLLMENQDEHECASLTDIEVMDACHMRGLPVTVSTESMRECLTNHLRMLSSVKHDLPSSSDMETLGLFSLHLVIIRNFLKNHKQQ